MAGVKSLLKAAANDMEQTTKAQAKPAEVKTEVVKPAEPAIDTPPKAEEPKKVSSKTQKEEPKPKEQYVCKICGYFYEGETIPQDFICPLCKHGVQDFEYAG